MDKLDHTTRYQDHLDYRYLVDHLLHSHLQGERYIKDLSDEKRNRLHSALHDAH